jgi:hypothetical protein
MKKWTMVLVALLIVILASGCSVPEKEDLNLDPEVFKMSSLGIDIFHRLLVWQAEEASNDRYYPVFGTVGGYELANGPAVVVPIGDYHEKILPFLSEDDEKILFNTEVTREEAYKIQKALNQYYEEKKKGGEEDENVSVETPPPPV